MRASRIHCSLAVQTVCPKRGRVGLTLNRQTELCPLCTDRYHLKQEGAFNKQLERERAEVEASGELEAARRERDRLEAAQQPSVPQVRAEEPEGEEE